jgi:hypothetical protein
MLSLECFGFAAGISPAVAFVPQGLQNMENKIG